MIFGGNWKKKHARLLLMKKSRKIKNLTKIQLKSILARFWSVQKSGMLFFSSSLQISCTTRSCKLQYVILRHDRHHMVFFCIFFTLTSFFSKQLFFGKSLRILAAIARCPKSRNFGLKIDPSPKVYKNSSEKKLSSKNALVQFFIRIF